MVRLYYDNRVRVGNKFEPGLPPNYFLLCPTLEAAKKLVRQMVFERLNPVYDNSVYGNFRVEPEGLTQCQSS